MTEQQRCDDGSWSRELEPTEETMSTDDLTRRARETAARSHHTRPALADLLSELADEADRLGTALRETVAARNYAMRQRDEERRAKEGNIATLNTAIIERDAARAEADRFRTLWDLHGKNDLLAERDAARAALGRVRDVVEDGDRLDGLWIYAPDAERALEGAS